MSEDTKLNDSLDASEADVKSAFKKSSGASSRRSSGNRKVSSGQRIVKNHQWQKN
jgi:hypothetical protein